MLPAQRFWRETVSLLDVTNESARCWENIPSYRAIIHRSGGGWYWIFTEAAKRRDKYPLLATDTEVNNCFSIY